MDLPERALLCEALVERARELGALLAGLDGLPRRGGLTVLVGEAGVGKTRLTRELAAVARARGVPVLSGRSVPGATPVPYRALSEATLAALRAGIPTGAPELAGFGRLLGRLVPESVLGATGGADESPVLLAEGLVRVLRLAAGASGCLLVLEDLHWADAETLDVVEYLVATLAAEPIHAVVTARPEGPVMEVLARLRRDPDAVVLGLGPLRPSGVEQVIADCLATPHPPTSLVEALTAVSEGNPFLVEELLAGLVSSGSLQRTDTGWEVRGELTPTVPFDFRESVRRRLATFDPNSRKVLEAAALLGRRFDWELLPAMAEVDGRAVVDALRTAVEEQLVEVDGEVFRFRHALTREAVLAELLPPERRALARRARPAVEGAHPGLPGAWCELAADLAEEAGERETAADLLVMSARRALASGALSSAERIADRARQLAAGTEMIDAAESVLLQATALAGKTDAAVAVGDALLARLDGAEAADVLVVLARVAVTAGDLDRAEALVARAREESGGDPAHAARVGAVGARVALERGHFEEAASLAGATREAAADSAQPEVECEALEVLDRATQYLVPGRAGEWFRQSAELAERHGLTTWQIRARHELALVSAYVHGDVNPLEEARALAATNGALVSVAVMDLALAEIALGNFERGCVEHARRCVEASRRYGLATLPVANLWLAGGHALADDLDAMESAAAAALEPDPDDPRVLGDLWGRVRATSAMVRDDRPALRDALDEMMVHVRRAPVTTSIFPNRILWALLHTIEDDDHGASARAEVQAASHLRSWPFFVSAMEVVEAVAAGRAGRLDEAATATAAATAHLGSSLDEGVTHYFRLLVAEAAVRDGWGEPAADLRRAEAFFATRGYERIALRCRTLLGRAGVPVPRRGRGDAVVPEHLRALGVTSRELDVLELVTQGLTNRQVAARLHLSPKTVERHLSSLFDRTGRRTRGELGALLDGLPG